MFVLDLLTAHRERRGRASGPDNRTGKVRVVTKSDGGPAEAANGAARERFTRASSPAKLRHRLIFHKS